MEFVRPLTRDRQSSLHVAEDPGLQPRQACHLVGSIDGMNQVSVSCHST